MTQLLGTVTLTNPNVGDIKQTLVSWSLAILQGQLYATDRVAVQGCDSDGTTFWLSQMECQILSTWPDGSIKVIKVSVLTQLPAGTSIDARLVKHSEGLTLKATEKQHGVSTNVACRFQPSLVLNDGLKAALHLTNRASQNAKVQGTILRSERGRLTQVTTGRWQTPAALPRNIELNYTLTQHLHNHSCELEVTLKNPNAAQHPGGLWDLGDPNAYYFNELALALKTTSHCEYLQVRADHGLPVTTEDSITLNQQGSGGLNWQSRVHVDKNNHVDVDGPGFHLDNNGEITDGDRASPLVILNAGDYYLGAQLQDFWQSFPSSVEIKNGKVIIGLFPHRNKANYELQPGEQKTFRLTFSEYDSIDDALNSQHPVIVSHQSHCFQSPGLLPLLSHSESEAPIHQLIQTGLTHKNNFFAKREQLDEYGWRHFGDLYADHEADGYDGAEPFVSHYNNQYDPIYGFLRQYLVTGDRRWFELGDDLARHVIDIDIYHTSDDKAEYNGGLFWHTDHYCQAETASHRSYSKRQSSDVYEGHQGGGGPGGQHCYTTGLLLHYWLTGNQQSLTALLSLTGWIENYYEGTGTLAELLIGLKNRYRADIKNPSTQRYPLDRGTGNYIVALLDVHLATSQQDYLDKAGKIIKATLHPEDDLTQRNLDEVETTWFYTVLLQAIVRFLQIKQAHGQCDQTFELARAALLHYCRYIADHEQPYLNKPEILEFPNATWVGQDWRKAGVLQAAAYYGPAEEKAKFEHKARFFTQYVAEKLADEPTLHYTRILALLMQNSGYLSCWQAFSDAPDLRQTPLPSAAPHTSVKKRLLKGALSLNIKQELIWLSKRSSMLQRIITTLGIRA